MKYAKLGSGWWKDTKSGKSFHISAREAQRRNDISEFLKRYYESKPKKAQIIKKQEYKKISGGIEIFNEAAKLRDKRKKLIGGILRVNGRVYRSFKTSDYTELFTAFREAIKRGYEILFGDVNIDWQFEVIYR